MIKSLFDYDDEEKPQPPEIQAEIETEESIRRQLEELNPATQMPAANDETETRPPTGQAEIETISTGEDDEIETITLPKIEQVYADAGEPQMDNTALEDRFSEAETEIQAPETETQAPEAEPIAAEIEPLPQVPMETQYRNVLQNETAPVNEVFPQTESIFQTGNVSQTDAKPLTTAETIRQSGMAWSAAIGLFGSVLFMLILGWFFDLLTGASPLGIVGGIIIGAGIGFYQFFRTTSQIFKKD